MLEEQPVVVEFNKKFEEIKPSSQFLIPVISPNIDCEDYDDWMSEYYDW